MTETVTTRGPSCNGVGQGERKSCRDRACLCRDRVLAKLRGFLVTTKHCMSRQSVAKVMRFSVAIE